jgi:hypothetical protein
MLSTSKGCDALIVSGIAVSKELIVVLKAQKQQPFPISFTKGEDPSNIHKWVMFYSTLFPILETSVKQGNKHITVFSPTEVITIINNVLQAYFFKQISTKMLVLIKTVAVIISSLFTPPFYQTWTPHFPELKNSHQRKQKKKKKDSKSISIQKEHLKKERRERKIKKKAEEAAVKMRLLLSNQARFSASPEALKQAHIALTRPGCVLTGTDSFVLSESSFNFHMIKSWLLDKHSFGIAWNFLNTNPSTTSAQMLKSFSKDAFRMFTTQNAGGTSLWSESLSFDVLMSSLGAKNVKLLATEMEISYDLDSKITDYSIDMSFLPKISSHCVGVSVTRLINFCALTTRNYIAPFYPSEVYRLLTKKLEGIIYSSASVSMRNKWEKQILHVFCNTKSACKCLFEQYFMIPQELRSNTFVLVTVTNGCDWIY